MDLNKADKVLRNLKPRGEAYAVALGDGMSCRVAPNGLKTLELRARLHGKVQRFRVGFYPGTTVSEAVAKAAQYRSLMKQGLHPLVAEQRASGGGSVPRNVSEAATRFCDGYLGEKVGQRWAREATRYINVEVLPVIGHYPLQQIHRSDLAALIEGKARALRQRKNARGTAANRLSAVVIKLFGWCAQQGWVSRDLSSGLPKPVKEEAKERALSAADGANEAGALWAALQAAASSSTTTAGAVSPVHARVLLVLALTGARCSEITALTTDDINLEAGTIRITDGKTAASRRTLPMTPAARSVIEAQLALPRAKGQQLLFPSPRAGIVIRSSEISRAGRALVAMLKLPSFTPHDCRRTAITVMAEAGIDGDIRRRVTGHQAPDIHGRVYDRALRLEDMRKAMLVIEHWYAGAANKAAASKTGNVVTMKGRGGK